MRLNSLIKHQIKQFNLVQHPEVSDPTFIPIHLTGGIGDVICAIDSIKLLASRFDVVVYTPHIEAFKYFYKGSVPVFKTIPEYTWHIELDSFVRFKINNGFHGFAVKEHDELFLQQQRMFKEYPELQTIVEQSNDKYFLISHFAKERNLTKRSLPFFSLGYPYFIDHSLQRRPTQQIITIHDGIDASQNIKGRSTKQWKLSYWNELTKSLKSQYPHHKIIQLGSKTSREIKNVDQCLINKTTLTEAFDILSCSPLHIDGDSGLVHAASRMNVPCVVLWGPTPYEFYGYKQNINIRASTCSSECYGLKRNWNAKCPIGYSTPKCMDDISPEVVLEEIKRAPFLRGPESVLAY
jgi:ADP-heptose:LPS heptosyltransferase